MWTILSILDVLMVASVLWEDLFDAIRTKDKNMQVVSAHVEKNTMTLATFRE